MASLCYAGGPGRARMGRGRGACRRGVWVMWNATPRDQRGKRYELTEGDALPAGEGARAVVSEDGLVTVSAMQNVAMVFLGMTQIRERQAELIQSKLAQVAEKSRGRVAVS